MIKDAGEPVQRVLVESSEGVSKVVYIAFPLEIHRAPDEGLVSWPAPL